MTNEEIEQIDIDPLAALFEDSIDQTLKEELPSKGKIYNDHTGFVTIRAMDFSDEQELAKVKNTNVIELLINRCVDSIDLNTLLPIDKLFLIYKIREVSFGSKLNLQIACQTCAHKADIEININDLPVAYVDESFNGSVSIDLPILRKEVVLRVPTGEETRLFTDREELLSNLWRFVISIGGITDKKLIGQAVKRLTSADTRTMISKLTLEDYGIQTKALFVCSNKSCGAENTVNIPITQDFFTVS
jgi:hypothetical protein